MGVGGRLAGCGVNEAQELGGREKLALVVLVSVVILAPFGAAASLVATVMIVVAAGILLLSARLSRPALVVVVLTLGLLIALTVGLANPNVPSVEVGLLGLRKSGTALLGLVIGLCMVRGREVAIRVLWYALLLSCVASLVLHLLLPDVESGVQRDADVYTSLFDGQVRLQGIFAGPFHAAMAACFVILAALPGAQLRASRGARLLGVMIGAWTLVETEVRTGFVAVVAGALLQLVLSRNVRTWARVVALAPVAVLVAIVALPSIAANSGVAAVQSLLTDPFDSRFTYRFTTWDQALSMIGARPITGWGPGAAGDTLSPFFPPGGHVTSHNMFLKFFVEGGLVVGLLFIAICAITFVLTVRGHLRKIGASAATILLIFGLTGSSVEAIPVSLLLAAVVGVAASGAQQRSETDVVVRPTRLRGSAPRS